MGGDFSLCLLICFFMHPLIKWVRHHQLSTLLPVHPHLEKLTQKLNSNE